MQLLNPTGLLAGTALTLAACMLASCSSGATSSSAGSPGATTISPSSSVVAPTSFTSPEYGYRISLPAGWTSTQAYSKWDGKTELSVDSFDVDRFLGPASAVSFATAVRWTRGLASYVRFLIASTVRYHSDTCPKRPKRQTGIVIGGTPGLLLEYNCGILINEAAAVRHEVGYVFVFKDDGVVDAASDPTDHAVFVQMLGSVKFPH
jgi:hypothetical protein